MVGSDDKPVTSNGHSASTTSPGNLDKEAELRENLSQFLPLYVIPLANLENLAMMQARAAQEEAAGENAAAMEGMEKQITVKVVVPQPSGDEQFVLPVSVI